MKRIIALLSAIAMVLTMGAFCVSGADDTPASESGFPFADVPAARWSNPYVVMMYNEGIVSGKSVNIFAPADNIKRSEFVKILCGVAGADTEGAEHAFTDVVSGAWYEPYVAWAAEQGIVDGVAPGVFAPDALITRQDMSVMIYRYVTKVLYPEQGEEETSPLEPVDPIRPIIPIDPIDPEEPPIVLPVEPKPEPEIMSLSEEKGDESGLPRVNEPVEFTDEAEIADYAKEAVSAMQQAGIIGGIGNADGSFRFEPKNSATREQACKMLGELYLIINEDEALPEPLKPDSYLITYDLAGGTAGWLKQAYVPGESFTLPTPTRKGYTFAGWSGTGISGKELNVTVTADNASEPLNFKANWTAIKYTITYILDGGTLWLPVTSYTVDSETVVVNEPGKAGFRFDGWMGTGLNKPTKNLKIPAGSTGNRVYTAVWSGGSKQAVAQEYLFDWIEENKTYAIGIDSGVKINYKDGGKDYSFTMLSRMPDYAEGRPDSKEVVLNTTVFLDGERWNITLKLYPASDPLYGLTLTDLNTGKVAYSYEKQLYFSSDGSLQITTTHDHAHQPGEECNYRCSYGYRKNLEKRLATELERMVHQVNQIFWYDINVYGYDMTCYGF